jgi:hypothetical protein
MHSDSLSVTSSSSSSNSTATLYYVCESNRRSYLPIVHTICTICTIRIRLLLEGYRTKMAPVSDNVSAYQARYFLEIRCSTRSNRQTFLKRCHRQVRWVERLGTEE